MSKRRRRKDFRREWSLWIAMAADHAGCKTLEAMELIETAIIDSPVPEDPSTSSEFYRIPRMEDHLPTRELWDKQREGVVMLVSALQDHRADIDAVIAKVSPRWRIERMPVIDRNLLRLGIAELLHVDGINARSTINGYVELAKSYGEDRTRRFVNGLLDQTRRDHGLPFSS